MSVKPESRGQWTSKWAFILASAGAATGLGNIWKFPYMAGDNGGGAFVLVYLVCVVLIGLPLMAGEVMVGRRAQTNPIDALGQLSTESRQHQRWRLLGWWGLLVLLVTLSFYSVVAGWSVYYIFQCVLGHIQGLSASGVTEFWGQFLSHPGVLFAYHTLFMLITLFVVAKGVERGLERASVILMPLLFILLIVLVVFAYFYSGVEFERAFHYLFDPHFNKITTNVVISALGHAFFTLAIGVGAMSIYGSYLPRKISIGEAVSVTALLDVGVACLTGLAIFPILFVHHLSPEQGPGLMFIALPIAFAKMSGGRWIGTMFFVLLFFAAWTSSINIAEPLVASLCEKTSLSRKQASWLVGILAWALGIISVLSFNVWQHVKVFGQFDLFTVITDLTTNVLLPLGGIGYAIFVGWTMKRQFAHEELAFNSAGLFAVWRFLCRYVAPVAILVIMVEAIWPA